MQLENNQANNNAVNAFSGNTSASLEVPQQQIDGKDVITRGAVAAAAGETLGLSTAETLAAVSRQNRRMKLREAQRTKQQRLREWAQKQKTLADEGFKLHDPDTDFLDQNTTEPFGQDKSDYY